MISEKDYRRVLEPLMSWSKNRFSQSGAIHTNIATSLKILNIPPSQRNARHIGQLRFFLDQLPFFKQLPSKLIDRLCHVVSSRTAKRHDCMCHQGDAGTEFFVILQGSVSVHIIQDESKKNIVRARRRFKKTSVFMGVSNKTTKSINVADARHASHASSYASKRRRRRSTRTGDGAKNVMEFDRKKHTYTGAADTSARTKRAKRKTLLMQKETTGAAEGAAGGAAEGGRVDEKVPTIGTGHNSNPSKYKENEENAAVVPPSSPHIDDLLEDHGEAVATLLAGDSFGQNSLISNRTRAATIICRESSIFMIISKEDYLAIASVGLVFDPSLCRDLLNKTPEIRTNSEVERMVRFVKPIPFFSQLDHDVARKLCSCMFLLKAKQRHIVILQGDAVDKHGGCFYIILKGSVSVHVAEYRTAPDSTGMRLLLDKRPKDGHSHKQHYIQHLENSSGSGSGSGSGSVGGGGENSVLSVGRQSNAGIGSFHDPLKVNGTGCKCVVGLPSKQGSTTGKDKDKAGECYESKGSHATKVGILLFHVQQCIDGLLSGDGCGCGRGEWESGSGSQRSGSQFYR